jgi:phospholipid/cholesterol/gamma-HCH transport system substrate-binding protein
MRRFNLELSVGFFLLLGILSLAYISINLGRLEIFGDNWYRVYALFDKAGGIKPGSVVEIAGVDIGVVEKIELEDYQAKLTLKIRKDIKLQEDAIASIKTKGLIGEKYVEITPGGSDKLIEPGGRIRETESAIDIEELLSKYAFGEL